MPLKYGCNVLQTNRQNAYESTNFGWVSKWRRAHVVNNGSNWNVNVNGKPNFICRLDIIDSVGSHDEQPSAAEFNN
jgi:hypothetical protein